MKLLKKNFEKKGAIWLSQYQCSCGNIFLTRAPLVKIGHTKSCGCRINSKLRIHSMAKTAEYHAWSMMKQRCLNPKCKAFEMYGGRGISVCKRWQESFQFFYEDMGPRPLGGTLERIDNNKGYSKDNCRWATMAEQAKNRRSTRFFEYNGRSLQLDEWVEISGINKSTIRNRLLRNWSFADAVTIKPNTKNKN